MSGSFGCFNLIRHSEKLIIEKIVNIINEVVSAREVSRPTKANISTKQVAKIVETSGVRVLLFILLNKAGNCFRELSPYSTREAIII